MAMDADVICPKQSEVEIGKLDGAVGFLLRMAQLKVYEQFFADDAELVMKPGEFSVLWVMSCNPGIRQSALGNRLMIKRAHMTKLIRAFEDQGLVSRRVPDEDRRAVELTLTAEGADLVERTSRWFFRHEERIGANLAAEERDQLVHLLRKFIGIEGRPT